MNVVKKTIKNPFGLTYKQLTMIEWMVDRAMRGLPLQPNDAGGIVYNAKNDKNVRAIVHNNFKNPDFRAALVAGLERENILGANSRVERRLVEGLDAETDKGSVDYRIRLEYIKEINKIAGVYAPEQKETRKLSLNLNMSEEEATQKIKELKGELGE